MKLVTTTYECDGPACGARASNYDTRRPKRWTASELPTITLPAEPEWHGGQELHFCSRMCLFEYYEVQPVLRGGRK